MFDNKLNIEGGPDWHHFHVYTDSALVAALFVAALVLAILLASAICYYLTRSIMLMIVGRLARQERHKWLRAAERHKVFHRLAPLGRAPALRTHDPGDLSARAAAGDPRGLLHGVHAIACRTRIPQ